MAGTSSKAGFPSAPLRRSRSPRCRSVVLKSANEQWCVIDEERLEFGPPLFSEPISRVEEAELALRRFAVAVAAMELEALSNRRATLDHEPPVDAAPPAAPAAPQRIRYIRRAMLDHDPRVKAAPPAAPAAPQIRGATLDHEPPVKAASPPAAPPAAAPRECEVSSPTELPVPPAMLCTWSPTSPVLEDWGDVD